MESVNAKYISCGEEGFDTQKLVTMTCEYSAGRNTAALTSGAGFVSINDSIPDFICFSDMFQKQSTTDVQRLWVIESGAHRVNFMLYAQDFCPRQIVFF